MIYCLVDVGVTVDNRYALLLVTASKLVVAAAAAVVAFAKFPNKRL